MALSDIDTSVASTDRYRIRAGRPDEMSLLPEIERQAARRFLNSQFGYVADMAPSSADDYLAYQRMHLALVAVDRSDRPVAFAVARRVDDACFLAEIDVLPDHMGRGIGRRLIAGVEDWARSHGFARIILTTFRSVSWNAPFYRRLGYREMRRIEVGPQLQAVRERQAEAGLRRRDRCCMCKDL